MIKPTIFFQTCLTKDIYQKDYPSIEFDRVEDLKDREYDLPLLFCSLQDARRLKREKPNLRRGLFYPEEFLRFTRYSQYIPKNWLLNSEYLVLPYDEITHWLPRLIDIFGESLFIRPDSPNKPFTGFSKTGVSELAFELGALRMTEHINPDELCIIASAKTIPETEWRFWLIDEQIVTFAPYTWNFRNQDTITNQKPSSDMLNMATDLAVRLVEHDNALVADFIDTPEGPKLVELNAVSTSGWYRGMDYHSLIEELVALFC